MLDIFSRDLEKMCNIRRVSRLAQPAVCWAADFQGPLFPAPITFNHSMDKWSHAQ